MRIFFPPSIPFCCGTSLSVRIKKYSRVLVLYVEKRLTGDTLYYVVVCGMISQYNNSSDSDAYAVKNLGHVIAKRIKLQGFIVADANMGPKYSDEHQKNLAKWIHEGTFKTKISITYGIENAVKGFLGMLRGENFGKAMLEIAPLEEK